MPPPQRSTSFLAWLLPLIALIVVGAGLGTYFGILRDDGTTTGTSAAANQTLDLGNAEVKLPDPAKLIETETWGEVPANQIVAFLAEGKTRTDAEQIAQTLGGTVVGEVEFIGAYQIETAGSTEADLQSALDQAATLAGVEVACPNQQTVSDEEIWGIRQTPLRGPPYDGDPGKGYELIGVQKAWDYINASAMDLPFSSVHVGVVDTGLYKGTGEFDGEVKIDFPDPSAGELDTPEKSTNNGVTVDKPTGSHGTMVAGLIGADPDNGGMSGVASVLFTNLTVSMINNFAPPYGQNQEAEPDPNDPTIVKWTDGKSYQFGGLVALAKMVESGAKVINCSWGTNIGPVNEAYANWQASASEADKTHWKQEFAKLVGQYRAIASGHKRFFEKMSNEHPDVLFVCSAGNDGESPLGALQWPSGLALPNMITVGNVMNDGTKAPSSNMANTTEGYEFEVTLAAPGQEAVQGLDSQGNPITNKTDIGNGARYGGGTSAAAPQVSGAAALLLSINKDLKAADIKRILSETARPGPAELAGKILAVDEAVFKVINEARVKQGLPELVKEEVERLYAIDAVATRQGESDTWTVKALVQPAGPTGSRLNTEVSITATAGCVIPASVAQIARADTAAGTCELHWQDVTVPPTDLVKIRLTRADSGASSVITFPVAASILTLSASPNPAETGVAVQFAAGIAGDGYTYKWDFGDGATVAPGGATAAHAYENEGTYTVSVTVYNEKDEWLGTAQQTVTVAVPESTTTTDTTEVTSATGGQQAGEYPPTPVGLVAIEAAIRAAADDVGWRIEEFRVPKRTPGAPAQGITAYGPGRKSMVMVSEFDTPGHENMLWCNMSTDVPWPFHGLTAFQGSEYWNNPASYGVWWIQDGNLKIRVEYTGQPATGILEMPEALWRRFGGATGPGTPDFRPNGVADPGPADELPFGSKADVQTGN